MSRILDLVDTVIGRRVITRRASVEFGPSPASRYAAELALFSDAELIGRDRADVLAEAVRLRELGEINAAARAAVSR